MQQSFLLIISVLGAIYAFTTRQTKIAFGLLIIGVSFIFSIPNLVTGNFWAQVFEAITMIVFALGVFVIVFRKKTEVTEKQSVEQEKND